MQEKQHLMVNITYLDLHQPWLVSPRPLTPIHGPFFENSTPGRPAGVWSRLGVACAQVVGRRCVVNPGPVAEAGTSVCVIDQRRHGPARWEVMPADPERFAIDHVAQRLSRQFTDLDTDLVARVVWDTYRHFDTHPTRDVVPILVQDAARDRLLVMPAPGRSALRGGSGRGK